MGQIDEVGKTPSSLSAPYLIPYQRLHALHSEFDLGRVTLRSVQSHGEGHALHPHQEVGAAEHGLSRCVHLWQAWNGIALRARENRGRAWWVRSAGARCVQPRETGNISHELTWRRDTSPSGGRGIPLGERNRPFFRNPVQVWLARTQRENVCAQENRDHRHNNLDLERGTAPPPREKNIGTHGTNSPRPPHTSLRDSAAPGTCLLP